MSSIFDAPIYMGPAYKDIHVSSVRNLNDNFIISINHDGIINDIFARVYCYDGQWYIWYEDKCYRTPVNSFTEAMERLETEIMQCVA